SPHPLNVRRQVAHMRIPHKQTVYVMLELLGEGRAVPRCVARCRTPAEPDPRGQGVSQRDPRHRYVARPSDCIRTLRKRKRKSTMDGDIECRHLPAGYTFDIVRDNLDVAYGVIIGVVSKYGTDDGRHGWV